MIFPSNRTTLFQRMGKGAFKMIDCPNEVVNIINVNRSSKKYSVLLCLKGIAAGIMTSRHSRDNTAERIETTASSHKTQEA